MVAPSQVDVDRYRFSGYNLPMLQLDETGPSYIVYSPNNFTVEALFNSDGTSAVWYGIPSAPGTYTLGEDCPSLI